MTRQDLPNKLENILKSIGGKGSIVEVCKAFWGKYEDDLRESGDLFYTWQYDIRWAATELRKNKKMKSAETSEKGIWELAKSIKA